MAEGLSIALPLSLDEKDGPYKSNMTLDEVAQQNIKMIVLTSPGERVMEPDFGVGIRNYLFEQETPFLVTKFEQK
jgi:phage baseplate assembly protein W